MSHPQSPTAPPEAEDFIVFLDEVAEAARTEGLPSEYLEELDAINEMRIAVELIQEEHHSFHTGS